MRKPALTSILALGAFLLVTNIAEAGRTPIVRVPTIRARGVRPNIAVPYLTNRRSTFGVYNGVAPRIYSAPVVNNPRNPGARPTYNIPFYGGKMGFSGRANGAVTRPTLTPQPIHR